MSTTATTEAGTTILSQLVLGQLQDPYPLYDELRELDEGVHWCAEMSGWVATRAADVRRIGEDPETYSSVMGSTSGMTAYDPSDPVQVRYGEAINGSLLFLDPPLHTQVRRVFRHAFTPKAVAKYRLTTQQITDALLAEHAPGDEVDFMECFATRIPIEVVCTILGLPTESMPMFVEGSKALSEAVDPGVVGEQQVRAIHRSGDLLACVTETAEARRDTPKDDLISLLVHTPVEGDEPLPLGLAIAQAVLLLAAGSDSTTHLLGNAISILIDRPELQQRLVNDPARLPDTIEEVLRFEPPFHFDYRTATKDHILAGREIKAGTPVFNLLAAANRDPRVFTDPSTFDVDREGKRHIAFGHGIHRCVGAPLARLEGAVGLERILQRFPSITHGSAPAVRDVANVVMRGWAQRPVTLLT